MLIFDRFPDAHEAGRFIEQIKGELGLRAYLCLSVEQSDLIDPFPGILTPPIVLVERGRSENRVISMATRFGGNFAGT